MDAVYDTLLCILWVLCVLNLLIYVIYVAIVEFSEEGVSAVAVMDLAKALDYRREAKRDYQRSGKEETALLY